MCLDVRVSKMHRPLIENNPTRDCPTDQRKRLDLGDRTMMSDEDEPVAIGTPNSRVVSLTEPPRAFADGIKHKLNVGRGASNCSEDSAGRRLLLPRLIALAGKPCNLCVFA